MCFYVASRVQPITSFTKRGFRSGDENFYSCIRYCEMCMCSLVARYSYCNRFPEGLCAWFPCGL